MTSTSSLVSAKVLSLFFAFEAVEISPNRNIVGTWFFFSQPPCLAPSPCSIWFGQDTFSSDITAVAAFDLTTFGLVTLSSTLYFSFLTIDLYFFSPSLVLLMGWSRLIGRSSALSSVNDSVRPSDSVESTIFSIVSRMMGWFNPTLITDWLSYLRIMLQVLSISVFLSTRFGVIPFLFWQHAQERHSHRPIDLPPARVITEQLGLAPPLVCFNQGHRLHRQKTSRGLLNGRHKRWRCHQH